MPRGNRHGGFVGRMARVTAATSCCYKATCRHGLPARCVGSGFGCRPNRRLQRQRGYSALTTVAAPAGGALNIALSESVYVAFATLPCSIETVPISRGTICE